MNRRDFTKTAALALIAASPFSSLEPKPKLEPFKGRGDGVRREWIENLIGGGRAPDMPQYPQTQPSRRGVMDGMGEQDRTDAGAL